MATVRPDCGVIVARMAGRSSAMDAAANVIKSRAEAAAASHVKSGDYIRSFKVSNWLYAPKGVMDRRVTNTDPQSWKIEFGFHHKQADRWIPGQFILTNAVRRGGK